MGRQAAGIHNHGAIEALASYALCCSDEIPRIAALATVRTVAGAEK